MECIWRTITGSTRAKSSCRSTSEGHYGTIGRTAHRALCWRYQEAEKLQRNYFRTEQWRGIWSCIFTTFIAGVKWNRYTKTISCHKNSSATSKLNDTITSDSASTASNDKPFTSSLLMHQDIYTFIKEQSALFSEPIQLLLKSFDNDSFK